MPLALLDHPVVAALAGEPGAWVVGGAVRDALLGRAAGDLDIVVEGDAIAVARRVAERLGGELLEHDRFGTAVVRAPGAVFDVAAARRETYPRPGALPEVALGATLAEDLARRDFTVNTFALPAAGGPLEAWPGARADLDAAVLRVLHPGSFLDDPTRLVRMARYAGRLGFAADEATAALAADAVAGGALRTVTGERLGAELRLLAREPQPAALRELARHGLGAALLPGFDVDEELVARAVALAEEVGARPDLVALASATSGDRLGERLRQLAFPAAEAAAILAASGVAAVPDGPPSAVDAALAGLPVEAAVLAAARGSAGAEAWLRRDRGARLAIDGNDLVAAGVHGPAVGAGLRAARAALLDGRAPDRAGQLAAALAAAGAG